MNELVVLGLTTNIIPIALGILFLGTIVLHGSKKLIPFAAIIGMFFVACFIPGLVDFLRVTGAPHDFWHLTAYFLVLIAISRGIYYVRKEGFRYFIEHPLEVIPVVYIVILTWFGMAYHPEIDLLVKVNPGSYIAALWIGGLLFVVGLFNYLIPNMDWESVRSSSSSSSYSEPYHKPPLEVHSEVHRKDLTCFPFHDIKGYEASVRDNRGHYVTGFAENAEDAQKNASSTYKTCKQLDGTADED